MALKESLLLTQGLCKNILPLAPSPSTSTIPFSTAHTDLLSLYALLYSSTTKLALALNPANPETHDAALRPLTDLRMYMPALATCVSSMPTSEGECLLREIRFNVEMVIQAVCTLLDSFVVGGDSYLVRTGNVHALIEKAKSGSRTEIAAVTFKLNIDGDAMKDALREVGEAMEEAESDSTDNEPSPDEDEDGWDGLGLGNDPMTHEELERARKVHTIIRISTLLHSRIISLLASLPVSVLDKLPSMSAALATTVDALASSTYASDTLATDLSSFCDSVKDIREFLDSHRSLLSEKQGKWLEACFKQIDKSAVSLNGHL